MKYNDSIIIGGNYNVLYSKKYNLIIIIFYFLIEWFYLSTSYNILYNCDTFSLVLI